MANKLQQGDMVLVDPFCNKGRVQVGKVIGYCQDSSKYGYSYYIIKYLFKPDDFGREVIHVDDTEARDFKIVNTMNIESLRVLYG